MDVIVIILLCVSLYKYTENILNLTYSTCFTADFASNLSNRF